MSVLQLDGNGLRQALRIATGSALGFTLAKLMNWPNGIFFTVYPMLLLGLVPVLNMHIIRQFYAGAVFSALFVLVVQGLFSHLPVVMTMMCFIAFAFLFYQMSRGANFLFGATTVVSLSIQLHFSTYTGSGVSIYPLIISNAVAVVVTVVFSMLMHGLFPDVAPRQGRVMPEKAKESVRHEVLLC